MKRAVKMLRNGASPEDKREFLQEVETMLALDHQNLVSIIGVAVQQAPWLVVLEFMPYGDLRAVLQVQLVVDVSFVATFDSFFLLLLLVLLLCCQQSS